MLQALFSGVSGLQSHQTRLDVIGNNIANVNTIGFKAGRVTFEDQLSQTIRSSAGPSATVGGQNPAQIGLGVSLGAVDTLQTQGNLQTTGKNTDIAIQGNGFFIVSGGGVDVSYTRDGSFDLDSDGTVVSPSSGLKLLGYVADANGVVDTNQPVTSKSVITVPVGTLTSVKQTTTSALSGNLNASSAVQSTAVNLSGNLDLSTTPTPLTSTIYDAQGNAHTLVTTLSSPTDGATLTAGPGVPTGALQRWTVGLTIDGSAVPLSSSPQYLYAVPNPAGSGPNQFLFTDNANPANGVGAQLSLSVTGTNGAPNFPLAVDFSGLTANSAVTAVADGQGGAASIDSKIVTLRGAVNTSDSTAIVNNTTVYHGSKSYSLTTTLSNPSYKPAPGANVPVGATERWDLKVEIGAPSANAGTLYDSSVAANNESAVYFVPGQGYVLADGNSPATSLGSLVQLSGGALPAGGYNQGVQADTGFNLNVDLGNLTNTKTIGISDGQTGPSPVQNSSVSVFDSLGVAHKLDIQYTRALVGGGAPGGATSRWEWTVTDNSTKKVLADSAQTGNKALFFDSKGNQINPVKPKVTVPAVGASSAFPVTLDFSAISQRAGDAGGVTATASDGYGVGVLQGFAVSGDGLVTGTFSNGESRALGQIALAAFANPAGLEKKGGNLYSASSNSGLAQVGKPNNGGRGQISTGFVELSNVDLSTEFTNLIVTQRGFQANTKIITAVDELLQDVINLKR